MKDMTLEQKINRFYKETTNEDVEKAWDNAKRVNNDFDEILKLSNY